MIQSVDCEEVLNGCKMHEIHITQEIVDTVLRAGEKAGAEKITLVRVKAGKLAGVEPSSLQFYFDTLTKDTMAAGARLVVETVEANARCGACRKAFTPQDLRSVCPACGSPDVEITSGRELYVEDVEVTRNQ